MIFNQVAKTATALIHVENSPFIFHLTGSRYFGTSTPESDFDFFIEWTEGLEPWLISHGFKLDSQTYSGDPSFVKVYKSENVDIQIVDNAKIKEQIQRRLFPLFKELTPNKELAKKLWHLCYHLYNDGMFGQSMGIKRVNIPLTMMI